MATKTPQEFRKLLRRSLFLNQRESQLFEKIPDVVLDGVFRHNFNGNLALAERVLFNRYRDVERVDRSRLEQEKQNIFNLARASSMVSKAIGDARPVLFVTDNDNDGSLAQAILIEFRKSLPPHLRKFVHVEYTQPIGKVRGLTREVVDIAFIGRAWQSSEPVLIVTADNGINNIVEVNRILAAYPKSEVLITDHHLPNDDVVVEGPRSAVFNPKNKPTAYFQKKNISGANTLGVLLKASLPKIMANLSPVAFVPSAEQRQALDNIDEIGSWANLLDYANADIADMPVRPYTIEKALELRPLLNVSTSMSNLVTGKFDAADIDDIALASLGTGAGTGGLDSVWLCEKIERVRTLNVVAHKLLNLYHRTGDQVHTYSEKDFYGMLAEEISGGQDSYSSVNPNFIEQLRPIIFNLAAIDNKDVFLTAMFDNMVLVFEDLRNLEKQVLSGLRDVGLLKEDARANSKILYPVDPSVMKVFNRRVLGKAYNQENNGFLLILDNVTQDTATGSMRSQYPINELLEDKSEIEAQLGISVDFQGHPHAAGFFIKTTDKKPLDDRRISEFNRWMDDRVAEMKIDEKINQLPSLEVDFASSGLLKKINSAVKANLAGMWGLPAILKFSPSRTDGVWVTDPETTEQINLADLVKKKRFGYQAIATDFHGGAIVVPVELLRTIVDSNYTKALRLTYMDDGVFMGSQVVDMQSLPSVINLHGGRRDQENLAEYYEKQFSKSNFMPLSRDDFRNSPYFRFNKYGASEFELWESVIIGVLDKVEADVLAVIDTEGTGLGKAPKCFNFGGTHIKVAKNSGNTIPAPEFDSRFFRNGEGREFLLTQSQIALLRPLEGDVVPPGHVVVHQNSLEHGVDYGVPLLFPGKFSALERVTNVKPADGRVVYNRTIDGFACSFLIKNNDFAITKEFEDLTGIGNWMVDKLGKPAAAVDRQLSHFYETLKSDAGEPAKIVFQAHNMPYDRGVISANFQHLNRLIDDHLTSDTAKIARSAKLAYDDTPVSSFDSIVGLPPKTYFYDSPYSGYSLSTFLSRMPKGKGGVFPDITAKLLLRYNPENERFSIIDRVENREVLLDVTHEDLIRKKSLGQLPNNAVKFSVERMSSRAMIRNILLFDLPSPSLVELSDTEAPHRTELELFQKNYHFDSTLQRNMDNFKASLWQRDQSMDWLDGVNLEELSQRFLEKNRDMQAKFHDGWMYEKVLAYHEPSAATLRVPADIVEQVNYYTDLPASKIRMVFDNVIRFKRHFKVEHALVHEEHNNIRQRSADGQGLSDTAYEAVLPQLLGMMKLYNPYYQSTRRTVDSLVNENIKGSMVQTMVGEEFNNELAMDSYSIAQMSAFRRQGKTDLIQRAQGLIKQGDLKDGQRQPIKFKLSSDVLPPSSAVYATPKLHVPMEQIRIDSEKLDFILVNEQMKTAIVSAKLKDEHKEAMRDIVDANDVKSIAYRNDLMTRYDHIDFSRKEVQVKKLLELVKAAFDGKSPKIPKSLELSDQMVVMANEMSSAFLDICKFTGGDPHLGAVEEMLKAVGDAWQARQEHAAKHDQEDVEFDINSVRQKDFLPNLEIERRDPMKFVLKHLGMEFCFPYVKQESAATGLITVPATAKAKRSMAL
jgi:hypothetical protein